MKSLPATLTDENASARADEGSALCKGLLSGSGEARIAFQTQLLDEVSDAIITTNLYQEITYWNRAAERCFGWSAGEAIGEKAVGFLQAIFHSASRDGVKESIQAKGTLEVELIASCKDGRKINIASRVSILYGSGGKPAGYVGILRDITEDKKQEQALIESERKYQELVKYAPAGIYEIDFREKKYVSINDVMCEWTGYSREELLQMSPSDMLGIRSMAQAEAERRRWTSGEKPDPGMEYKAYTKDGREIFALLHARFKMDESGKPTGVTVIAHNITERKKAEEALRESERKYKELVKCAPAGIYEIDFRSRRYLSVNDAMCQISGYSMEEMLTMSPFDLLDEPSRLKFQERINHWMIGEEPDKGVEFTVIAKDGRKIVTELNVTYTRDENGSPKGATVIAHDITRRKRAEEALRKSDARLQEELDGTRLLQSISTELIFEDNVQAVYEKLLDTALKIMKSECASIQMLDGKDGGALGLRLLASRGFGCEAAEYWGWICVSAATACGAALRSGRRVIVPDIEKCDYMRGTEDQKRFLQVGIHSCQSTPLVSHTGKIVGMISTQWKKCHEPTERQLRLFDVLARQAAHFIERRKAEEELRESEARLAELSRSLAVEVDALRIFHRINSLFIQQADIESVYMDILDAAISLTGADCGDLQLAVEGGQALEIAVHTGLGPDFVRYFHRVSGGKTACEKVREGKARVIVDDVSTSPLYDDATTRKVMLAEGIRCVQSTPMFSGTGSFMGVFSTLYKYPHEFSERELRVLDMLARQAADVIERVRIEVELQDREKQAQLLAEALEKKNRLVTDFFINISHEFKTPLTILMLGLELLEKKLTKLADTGIDKNLAVMKQNSYRLSRLVSNLLDITKLDAGFMEPLWELRNIVEWLGNLVKTTEFYARQKGLSLSFASSAPEKAMFIDGFMLDRIMLNLLSNAIKHTQPGGAIGVFCGVEEGGVTISVRDTGEGIPDDKKLIIFDRFSQVNTSFTRGSEGTGIGLALVKSLADLLGGRIWFTSAQGSGSEFFVHLPAVQRNNVRKAVEQTGLQLEKRVQMELSDIT